MPKTISERMTVKLSRNSFLNMYVHSRPNKKENGSNHSDEFCDCLIHMINRDIIIQVKQNDEPNANDWFKRKILGDARLQLTASFAALYSCNFEIWNRDNTICISKGNNNTSFIYPVIVFEKKDSYNYQQVALPERIIGTERKYVPCNIFSMEDFEYATSMIPTGPDFLDYLSFRYDKLKDLSPATQLFPFYMKDGKAVFLPNAKNNEQIMVIEFLSRMIDNPEKPVIMTKMWRNNLAGLENEERMDHILMMLLSFFSIRDLPKWDSCHELLVKNSNDKACTWVAEPIVKGNVGGKTYGIMLSYLPLNDGNVRFPTIDKEMVADAEKYIKENSFEAMYIFQYMKAKTIRLTKITISNCNKL